MPEHPMPAGADEFPAPPVKAHPLAEVVEAADVAEVRAEGERRRSAPHADLEPAAKPDDHLRAGACHHVVADEVLGDGYAAFLDDLGLSAEELRAEAVRRHVDHAGACRLAYELYLAGTGQQPGSFTAPTTAGPVADVRAHLARLHANVEELQADREAMAGRLRRPLEKRDIAGKSPADLALAGVSIRDAVRARLADAVKLASRRPEDEVYAWLIAAYSDCLELATLLVPPADPAP